MRTKTGVALIASALCACVASASETFFGVDSAAAWLARPGFFKTPTGEKDLFRYTVGKIAETGFRQARERLSWREVNPQPGQWKPDHYLKVYSLYREKGIRVSGMFHDAPDWTLPKGKLPTDLKAVYDFAKRLGETFGDLVDDWEFWNEEDIGFCEASAWDYVAAAKAAYLGFKDARPDRPALMGALCKPSRSAYDRTLFAEMIRRLGKAELLPMSLRRPGIRKRAPGDSIGPGRRTSIAGLIRAIGSSRASLKAPSCSSLRSRAPRTRSRTTSSPRT